MKSLPWPHALWCITSGYLCGKGYNVRGSGGENEREELTEYGRSIRLPPRFSEDRWKAKKDIRCPGSASQKKNTTRAENARRSGPSWAIRFSCSTVISSRLRSCRTRLFSVRYSNDLIIRTVRVADVRGFVRFVRGSSCCVWDAIAMVVDGVGGGREVEVIREISEARQEQGVRCYTLWISPTITPPSFKIG